MANGLNTAQIIDMARSMGSGISDSQAQSILSSAWDQNQYGADAGKVKAALSSLGGANTAGAGGGGGGGSWDGGQVFDTAKSALQQRYDSLIASLKGQQATETERQTVTTSNELGKRGILPSSGVAGQEMTNALNPITRGYSGLMSNAASELQTNLSNLALQQYNSQQTAAQNAAQNAIAQGQLANQTKQTEYNVNAPYFKPESTGTGGLDISTLFKSLGGLGGVTEPKPTTAPNQINNSINPFMTPKPTSSFKPISSSGYAGYA